MSSPELLTIDELSEEVAKIYRDVTIARDPMSRWVQIINDVTILGEDVRRKREPRALERAGKVLMRLIDFVGYYMRVHVPGERKASFADALAYVLRVPSSLLYMSADVPAEGLTRWVYAKYPNTCSKCGQRPCHCLVTPWVFENRREEPAPYETLRDKAVSARRALRTANLGSLNLSELFDFFAEIYRNQYFNQERWHLVMHLSEELGEATIELSRVQLLQEYEASGRSVREALPNIADVSKDRIEKNLGEAAATVRESADAALAQHLTALESESAYDKLYEMVGEKFKEELADVVSWLSAIIYATANGETEEAARQMVSPYVEPSPLGTRFRCAWCRQVRCTDGCLITNHVAGEVVEHVLKF